MGCGFSKESPICRGLSRLSPKRSTRPNNVQRASHESQRRSELADKQHPVPNGHANHRPSGGFSNSARGNLNATEQQRHTGSRTPPQFEMPVDRDTTRQLPESQTTAEGSAPTHPESSTGPSTPNHDKVLGLIENLRSKVARFVAGSLILPSEVERSHTRERIYRLVIGLVQDKEANSNPQAYKEVAKKIEEDLEPLPKPFPMPSRTESDLHSICEIGKNIKETMARDEGAWRFEWETQGRRLEFPRSKRDERLMDLGVEYKGNNEGALESE